MKWLDEDIDLDTTVMKCQKRSCGAEFVGIPGLRAYVKPIVIGLHISNSLDIIKDTIDTIGQERNLYVARDKSGIARGIGTSYVSCIINTARRMSHSIQAYNMFTSRN
jgi:hypothetical protein